jgi:5'-3' exonuclease
LIVHLVDGTYELFRHFHGGQRFARGPGAPYAAVAGVLHTVLGLLEQGATHVGVATDHVIESFRNRLWPGYKTGSGIDRALLAQFHPLEEALVAMGVATWPMVELEADDALASAAALAAVDPRVDKVCIWSPDKDLAQCVREDRVVQIDRRGKAIRGAAEVRAKYGVVPERIPDWLALAGDAADGYPGIRGIGSVGAARLVVRHGPIEGFPAGALEPADRESALLFKRLATLRTDAALFDDIEALRWSGPTAAFAAWSARIAAPRLLERALAARPLDAYDARVTTEDSMATSKKTSAKKTSAKTSRRRRRRPRRSRPRRRPPRRRRRRRRRRPPRGRRRGRPPRTSHRRARRPRRRRARRRRRRPLRRPPRRRRRPPGRRPRRRHRLGRRPRKRRPAAGLRPSAS